MTGGTIQRLEVGLDAAAAILLGAATAFVLLRFDASNGYAVTGAGIVFAWALYGLQQTAKARGDAAGESKATKELEKAWLGDPGLLTLERL